MGHLAFQGTTWFSLPPSSPSKRAPHNRGWKIGSWWASFWSPDLVGIRSGLEVQVLPLGSEDGWSVEKAPIRGAADGRFPGIPVIFFVLAKEMEGKWFKRTCFWGWRLVGRLEDGHLKILQVVVFCFFSGDFLAIRCCPPFSKASEKNLAKL